MHTANPVLSFIVPWCDRPELRASLARNRAVFQRLDLEVVIVNIGGDQSLLEEIVVSSGIDRAEIINLGDVSFNKCLALNLGALCAKSPVIFLLDCDVVIQDDLVLSTLESLRPGTFLTVAKAYESDPQKHRQVIRGNHSLVEKRVITELTFANGNRADFEFWISRSGRSVCGLMAIYKSDYIEVNGSNAELTGWGFEDYDLQIRLQALLGLARFSVGTALHLTHPCAGIEGMMKSETLNIGRAYEQYAKGNYLGTYSADTLRWERDLHIQHYSRVGLPQSEGSTAAAKS
jgi:glycosyltransferase involved in cell wall biosynthesis